jgi:hypothetical protein
LPFTFTFALSVYGRITFTFNGGSKRTAFLPAPLTFRMVWHH